MECGPAEYWCHFLAWFSENSEFLKQLPQLSDWWAAAFGSEGWLMAFIQQHGEKIIAAASLAFAIWRWWVYRERILHKRLDEYLRESDARLAPTSAQVVEALLRPGRTASLPQPAFAVELRDILDTNGWRYWFGLSTLNAQANWQLGRRLAGIRNRMKIARDAISSLQKEQAQLHMIAGAVAAARARRVKDRTKGEKFDKIALREFQKVMQLPGHQRDIIAKENEAYQWLRIGNLRRAMEAFEELEILATDIEDEQKKAYVIARSKRFRAQMLQTMADGGAAAAWIKMTADSGSINGPGALELRSKFEPDGRWETIEQAEMHYVTAYIAFKCNYSVREPQQLQLAEARYEDVCDNLPKWFWLLKREHRTLCAEAKRGLARVRRVNENPGDYDEAWLRVN
ncbi:MAG: hypothetical protein AB7O43_00615 [Hyphomicrobiaceae bacterium]